MRRPDVQRIMGQLKDFQRRSVDYVFERLYGDNNGTRRFLLADEVGLGKTLVARGVVAKAVDHLWDQQKNINVVYICANQDIARQNIERLDFTGEHRKPDCTRLTMLATEMPDMQASRVSFVSLTPGTSFRMSSATGWSRERAVLYHMLRDAWVLGDTAALKNLFQCSCAKKNWRQRISGFDPSWIDPTLAGTFVRRMQRNTRLCDEFHVLLHQFRYYRERWPEEYGRDRSRFIGKLRKLLARTCIDALKPDFVILDEFQRFKDLLEEDTPVAELARAIFDRPSVRVLLLSATPYKMYTHYDDPDGDDHYTDFFRTARFLLNSDEATQQLREDLSEYRSSLYRIGQGRDDRILAAKNHVEDTLRSVMARTERVSTTRERDSMVTEMDDGAVRLAPADLMDYVSFDRIGQLLNAPTGVEYWKSAPYLLNIMERDAYQVKRRLVEAGERSYVKKVIVGALAQDEGLLRSSDIEAYRQVDPRNAKLRALLDAVLSHEEWRLLWIPPSLPYYTADSPFGRRQLRGFSKRLIFSGWQVVPKAIALLVSYEAERRMIGERTDGVDYSKQRRRLRPLLTFTLSRKRHTGMAALTLFYPCLTLAREVDPLRVASSIGNDERPSLSAVKAEVRRTVRELIKSIVKRHARRNGRADERWYWAGLALLDQAHAKRRMDEWFRVNDDRSWWGVLSDEDGKTRFDEHLDRFYEVFSGEVSNLGPPPDDLIDVLTKVALASPAVGTLRALMRQVGSQDDVPLEALAGAARVALGFRTLFNVPEVISMVRRAGQDETRYWESVLDYCAGGNLQATLDEYSHVLRDSLGLVGANVGRVCGEIAAEMATTVALRTSTLSFDEITVRPQEHKLELNPVRIRCRFALRFGEARSEEGEATRRDDVRRAFNSPFWPFVLATTSVGEEGLDFHQYCHHVYHWNLPSNPVDLEQREGRVHRYKGHAIRKNVAGALPLTAIGEELAVHPDPWQALFEEAEENRPSESNDLIPYWVYEVGGEKIVRYVPALPLSREEVRLDELKRMLVAYRLVFGQPRQEDLLRYIEERLGDTVDADDLARYQIDLAP